MTGSLVIGDRAWHLRLVRWQFNKGYQPRDLCSHFWIVVAALLYLPLRLLGVLEELPFKGAARGWNALKSKRQLPEWPEKVAMGVGIVAGVVFLLVVAAVVVMGIVQVFLAHPLAASAVAVVGLSVAGFFIWRANRSFGSPREPSLVMAYVKAKKRRVCPLIEVRKPESAG